MRIPGTPLLLALVTGCTATAPTERDPSAETYGGDDRRDVSNVQNGAEAVALSRSAAALIPWDDLDEAGPSFQRIRAPTLRERYSACGFEPFGNQPSAAFCSGFLAGPDLLVTAGHCFRSETACDDLAIVFGYAWESAGDDPTLVSNDDVYWCQEVVARQDKKNRRDYTVVRLDREVIDRPPLPIDRERTVEAGDDLVVIGCPAGLPLKIDEGAAVHEVDPDRGVFVTTGDTYARSSGSMVVHGGLVVGIHVTGASDFVKHPSGCRYSRSCAEIGDQSGCPGSLELHSSVFAEHIPELPELPDPPPADDPDAGP